MNRRTPPRWLLLTVAVAINLVWALSYPISKTLIESISPLAIATARMVGAALVLAPLLRRRDIPRVMTFRDLALLAGMGIAGCGLPALLQYVGTARSTASNVAMIVALEPSAVTLSSALLLGEKLRARKLVALAIALLGVAIITVDPNSLSLLSSRYLVGNLYLLCSIFFYSTYTIAAKVLSVRWGTSALTALPFVAVSLVMLPGMTLFHPEELRPLVHLAPKDAYGLAFTVALATAGAYVIWNWLLLFLSASEVALSLYVQPIAGALLSTWLLGEKPVPSFLFGSILVLGALVVAQSQKVPLENPEEAIGERGRPVQEEADALGCREKP